MIRYVTDWLKENKKAVIAVVFIFLAIFAYGQLNPKQETEAERSARLSTCAGVSGESPTFSERQDNEYAGICSGFTKQEIENASESSSEPSVKPPTVNELLALTNAERKKANVKPLVLDNSLNESAQLQGKDMVKDDYYGHVNPKTGKRGYSYITDLGVSCVYVSENATADTTSKGALNDWLISPKHKEAMLDPRYDSTGFAIVKTDYGYSYFIQHFCDKGQSYIFQIVNKLVLFS